MISSISKLKSLRYLLIISLPIFFVGCQQSPKNQSGDTSSYPSGCSGNAYLTKYDCSIERMQHAAEEGSADAQYALGYMYYYGISTMRDQDTAVLWIERAAKQGQPLARRALTLIKQNANFSDLHRAALGNSGGASIHQRSADVAQMNANTPSEPITSYLPGYKAKKNTDSTKPPVIDSLKHPSEVKSSSKTAIDPKTNSSQKAIVNDPRLSLHAKPVTAASLHSGNKGYTLQLMASYKISSLESFARSHKLSKNVHFYQTKMNNKPLYLLTYGNYKTAKFASIALDNLPKEIKNSHPWVKSVRVINKEVKLQKVVG